MRQSQTMTIGQLSRRTGVPIKVLRDYENRGFLSTLGRSRSNYRLFGEKALWCVQLVEDLRSLGLTLKEIQAFIARFDAHPDEPMSVLLEAHLAQVVARIETQIATLQTLRHRILEFQSAGTSTPARPVASTLAQFLARDPGCDTQHSSHHTVDE